MNGQSECFRDVIVYTNYNRDNNYTIPCIHTLLNIYLLTISLVSLLHALSLLSTIIRIWWVSFAGVRYPG